MHTCKGLDAFIENTLGLTKLPTHLSTLGITFVFFTVVHQVLAPLASEKWFPVAYGSKGKRAKNNWSMHVVSQVHTAIIVPMSLWSLAREAEDRARDKAFGWDDDMGFVLAVACGYFLWDTIDAVVNFVDLGFVVHGTACLFIYLMSFTPFMAYYGIRCLLWEISTVLLNNHWFLDKTGRTGSTTQLLNGVFLISAFFGVRIVYGGILSYDFLRTLGQVRDQVPVAYVLVHGLGNIVLQGLNWFWFYKMIDALRRRFSVNNKEHAKLVDRLPGDDIDTNGKVTNGNANDYGTSS